MAEKRSNASAIQKVLKGSRKTYWDSILAQLKANETPSQVSIIEGLRSSHPIPKPVREFLADHIAGNYPLKRGRQKNTFNDLKYAVYRAGHRLQSIVVGRWERIYKQDMQDRQNVIKERVAKRHGISFRTVETAISKSKIRSATK